VTTPLSASADATPTLRRFTSPRQGSEIGLNCRDEAMNPSAVVAL
jgi:hypothetical protein